MFKKLTLVAALALVPAAAFAQNPEGAQGGAASGIVGGATAGAVGGAVVGGPIGAVAGGVGGAVVGGFTGAVIGDNTPRFQRYVVEQRVPSYTYAEPVAVGTVLPNEGVVYREVPAEYGATQYRYTVVNNRTVLVEPRTRRIVQVIE
jgi:predicted lipid-binding transport protein (Tim44 family)